MRVVLCTLLTVSTSIFSSSALAQDSQSGPAGTRRGYVASVGLPPGDGLANDSYPHITTLEKAILGQAYIGQSLPDRLGRMETKAFGKPSTDPDLSQRTDNLEDYAVKTLHQRPWGAGSAADTDETAMAPGSGQAGSYPVNSLSPSGAEAASGAENSELQPLQTDYPHITALEKSILGQTFPGQPLPDRLSRMETKAFGKPSTIDDYSERTDALEAYAQKKLHAKPFVQEQKQEAQAMGGGPGQSNNQGSSTGSKVLSIVGNSLLSMAGVGRMGMGGLGMPGMGGNPVFGQGMGGGIMPGFGGVRMRPRSQANQQQQQPTQQVNTHPEDPAVHDAAPPPAEAKMLTKVGWCEVQLFGQTFPNLHLPQRLQQLNKELNYAPNKTSLELMDDAAGLIKAVQARKQSGHSVAGASPTNAPQASPTNAPQPGANAPLRPIPKSAPQAGANPPLRPIPN